MISHTSIRTLLFCLLALAACKRSELKPDGGTTDGGPTGEDGGGTKDGDVVVGCNNDAIDPAPNGETCSYTAGAGATLIRGDIVAPDSILENGHLLINADGKIACAACDCSGDPAFAGATVVACLNGLVTPGLINAHEHLTFAEGSPVDHGTERYEHRHDWREGQGGHPELPTPPSSSGDDPVLYAELRHLLGGATTVNGSGGADGLLRNVDRNGQDEGLGVGVVRYQTFPLGDSSGARMESGCGYPNLDSPTAANIANSIAYTPHIAEGIDLSARNEFACLSGEGMNATDVILPKTAVIHGVGLLAADYASMAAEGAALIWSARTNIDLYGHTAPVTLAANAGVQIALGTDWPSSGSMNPLRELACFSEFNTRNLGGFFTDRQLFDMATQNGADVLKLSTVIGSLATGKFADVAIFDQSTNRGFSAAIKGEPKDVALVMRGGTPLYGDAELISGLTSAAAGCETLTVCTKPKRACVEADTGRTIAQLQSAVRTETIELFACGVPEGEPSCIPFRTGEFTGMPASGDMDGDGVMDAMDNCAAIFNPARDGLDVGQADTDADMEGDACDVCPLDADSTTCTAPDPNDRDKDGVPNANDNCPGVANMDQADRDTDMIGDLCDQCPDQSNLGGVPCTATVYGVKQGTVTGRVRLTGMLVTAAAANGYFVQTVPGDPSFDAALMERFSGLFVFNGMDPKPAIGDRVDVDGDVGEFFGQVQLAMSAFTVVSSGNPPPAPVAVTPAEVTTGGPRAAELEGVVVGLGQVTITEINPPAPPMSGDSDPTNEFVVEGVLRVNDYLYRADPFPVVNDVIGNLQGVLRYANNNSKVEPRSAEDLGIPPRLVGFVPSQLFARTGLTDAVPPGGFTVTLNRPTDVAVDVTLTAVGLTVPATVQIDAGESSADVPITTTAAGTATITASYDGVTADARVIVYDDAAPRTVVSLTIERASIAIDGSAGATVRIDLPGAAGGTQVTLQVTPPALATAPGTVTVAEGAFEATFTVDAGSTEGDAVLRASIGASFQEAEFSVVASVDRPPMAAGDLVITEIHRNPSRTPNEELNEWFELYNPTADSITIDGLAISDNSGMATIAAPAAVIPPGGYAVLAYGLTDNGGLTPVASYGGGSPDILLANGDDVLRLTYNAVEIDIVDWAAAWPGAGQGVAMCLVAPYAADNNVDASWSNSVGVYGTTTDQGGPGAASDATNCPP